MCQIHLKAVQLILFIKQLAIPNPIDLSSNHMCDMLHLCVDNTFRLEGSYLSRCLMGFPVMPIYSNLCIVLIKRLSLSTYLTIRQ